MSSLGDMLVWTYRGEDFLFNIIISQLMPKRINIPVNRLMARPLKLIKPPPEKTVPRQPVTFEQLFQLARQQCQHSQSTHQAHPYPHSNHTSQHQSDKVKSSSTTPQNSSRNWNRSRERHQKLNRSLQSKSNSIQKMSKGARSYSSEKRRVVQYWKQQQQPKITKELQKHPKSRPDSKPGSPKLSQKRQFEQQFRTSIEELDHSGHSHLRQTECFLSIEQTFKIMKQLHYLRKIEDQKFLVRVWQELEGDTFGGIPSQNLFQFLTFINHYNPSNLYTNTNFKNNNKKIKIDSNLKIVINQHSKLEIYEQYLTLRVNRILYGSGDGDYSSGKKLHRTSNIKIVDEDSESQSKPLKQKITGNRLSFNKKTSLLSQPDAVIAPRRSVKLRTNSHGVKSKKQQDMMEKDQSQETICYSEISETKESGKNLTSNQSEVSLPHSDHWEEVPERKPILSIDVNLGEGISEKLLVFEGESALEVSRRLVQKYSIDESLRLKFEGMLKGHIRNLLWRIEQVSEQLCSDRQE